MRPRERAPDPASTVLRPKVLRAVIAGADGRLGSTVASLAGRDGLQVVGLVTSGRRARTSGRMASIRSTGPTHLASVLRRAEVYLSATTPTGERRNLPIVARAGVPAVVATTGIAPPPPPWLLACARKIPIVLDPNFSLGIHWLRRALGAIGPLPPDYGVSIVETHRTGKTDRPSGTARDLARVLPASADDRGPLSEGKHLPEIASLRSSETPGIHVVQIAGASELLRFEHIAYGRTAFATGMLRAARRLGDRTAPLAPGLYSFAELMASEDR